jgi:hypothetical protein
VHAGEEVMLIERCSLDDIAVRKEGTVDCTTQTRTRLVGLLTHEH